MATPLTPAWLAGDPAARRLLPLDPWRAEDRASALAVALAHRPADGALAALAAMNDALGPCDARARSLDALAGGAAAVLTGQQAGLFLGPLYTFYKAAHAVALARALAEEGGQPVVPIFWVASEDHDFAEAAWHAVPGEDGEPLRLEIPPRDDRPIPLACRTLGAAGDAAVEALADAVEGLPHAAEVIAAVRRHYHGAATFSDAFAGWLGEVFADEGLLILDPRHPAAMEAALPVHRRAFQEAPTLALSLLARTRELGAQGFVAPVHVRPGAPLPFVHPDDPRGPRFRVEPGADAWTLVGREQPVPDAVLRGWLADEPARFSSSALLRPVVQDLLLPTVATVAGPGEIAYLAQTLPLYAAFGRPMPLLAPRARFRVVGPRERRLCQQTGLAPDDTALARPELLALAGRHVRPPDGPDPRGLDGRLLAPVAAELQRLSTVAAGLDPGLAKAVDRASEQIAKQLRRLADRYRRTLAQQDDVTAARVDRLVGTLRPGGAPQERVLGLPFFAARDGLDAFKRRVLDACAPFPTASWDLQP